MTTIKSALPITRDIRQKRGADFHWTIKLKENDGVTVKNTTGYTSTLTLKRGQNGETYATITATNSAASGQFNYDIAAATVDGYDFSSADYEVLITDASGGKTIPFVGTFVLF
jgi:hypothetical protein